MVENETRWSEPTLENGPTFLSPTPCVTTGSYPIDWTPADDWLDWLTLLTAVLADKPLGRQRPLTTGPKDVTGL